MGNIWSTSAHNIVKLEWACNSKYCEASNSSKQTLLRKFYFSSSYYRSSHASAKGQDSWRKMRSEALCGCNEALHLAIVNYSYGWKYPIQMKLSYQVICSSVMCPVFCDRVNNRSRKEIRLGICGRLLLADFYDRLLWPTGRRPSRPRRPPALEYNVQYTVFGI